MKPGDTNPISELLRTVDTPEGRQRVHDYLRSRPFPHYEQGPGPGLLVRIEADGRKTVGRFVQREFRAMGAVQK